MLWLELGWKRKQDPERELLPAKEEELLGWLGVDWLENEGGELLMKFRKKPVVIEAIQFTGDNVTEAEKFMESSDVPSFYNDEHGVITIKTLEGEMIVGKGDWIIKGIKGEFYPCKPDIFEQTYDKAEETPIHNQNFIDLFNRALVELNTDPQAMSTFSMAVMEVFESFAKNNNKTVEELVCGLVEIHKKMKK